MAVLRAGEPWATKDSTNSATTSSRKDRTSSRNGARLKSCGVIARAFVGLLLLVLFASHLPTCDASATSIVHRETVSRTDKTFGAWSPVGISKAAVGRKFNIGTDLIGRALGLGKYANVASKWTEGCIYTSHADDDMDDDGGESDADDELAQTDSSDDEE